ncbi:hypothetical protein NC653_031085 [Populus alba x Populus x berolinensis]|uniref:Uncharacterized protein n=1 Tax=Populus alba x Populus x berolinensis TaxID=444605 RepID=A0AAD6LXX3_9ROSI|nr:hypothetical protein NC653_031085 [Populus alba x Populus x berolinensis]
MCSDHSLSLADSYPEHIQTPPPNAMKLYAAQITRVKRLKLSGLKREGNMQKLESYLPSFRESSRRNKTQEEPSLETPLLRIFMCLSFLRDHPMLIGPLTPYSWQCPLQDGDEIWLRNGDLMLQSSPLFMFKIQDYRSWLCSCLEAVIEACEGEIDRYRKNTFYRLLVQLSEYVSVCTLRCSKYQ